MPLWNYSRSISLPQLFASKFWKIHSVLNNVALQRLSIFSDYGNLVKRKIIGIVDQEEMFQ